VTGCCIIAICWNLYHFTLEDSFLWKCMIVLHSYFWHRPPDQPRDAARWEECSDLDEKSFDYVCVVVGEWKGFAREHQKVFFMRLKMNYSKRCSRRRVPQRVSIDPIGSWRVGLSDTKHVRRNMQSWIRTCSPALWQWCGESPPQDVPRSDSVVWP